MELLLVCSYLSFRDVVLTAQYQNDLIGVCDESNKFYDVTRVLINCDVFARTIILELTK
jgi:hypothetical protein